MTYAWHLRLVKSDPGVDTSSGVTDTVINVKMELGYHGHTPNSQQDLFTLPVDLRCVRPNIDSCHTGNYSVQHTNLLYG